MPPQNEEEAAAHAGRPYGVVERVMDGISRSYLDPNQVRNPYFDKRSRTRSGAGGVKDLSNLYRGYITHMRQEVNTIKGANGPKTRHVRFQYNPTQIALNYSINTDAFPQQSRGPADTSPVLATTSQTLSWTLYFNRTYETAGKGASMGVMADIQSLEYLLGSFDAQGMQAVECLVNFGMTKSGKPLAFAGWISDLNVTFLQFTHRMIPTVAMVEVGMVRRFIGDSLSSGTPVATSAGVTADIKDLLPAFLGGNAGRTAAPRPTSTGVGPAGGGGVPLS